MGVQLGTEAYDLQAFTNSVWAMTLGGAGWLVATLVFLKLDRKWPWLKE